MEKTILLLAVVVVYSRVYRILVARYEYPDNWAQIFTVIVRKRFYFKYI